MNKPIMPQAILRLYENIEKNMNEDYRVPTHVFIARSVEAIKNKFPDAKDSEINTESSEHCTSVSFTREYPNPNYEQEMVEYNKQLTIYHDRNPDIKAEYEAAEKSRKAFCKSVLDAIKPMLVEGMISKLEYSNDLDKESADKLRDFNKKAPEASRVLLLNAMGFGLGFTSANGLVDKDDTATIDPKQP